jgi:hypothetical protein
MSNSCSSGGKNLSFCACAGLAATWPPGGTPLLGPIARDKVQVPSTPIASGDFGPLVIGTVRTTTLLGGFFIGERMTAASTTNAAFFSRILTGIDIGILLSLGGLAADNRAGPLCCCERVLP